VGSTNKQRQGGSPNVFLNKSGHPAEIISGSNVVVVNNTTLSVDFDIPAGASVGSWDLHVGSMDLPDGFNVNLLAGINDPKSISVLTYPNPANSTLYVENAKNSSLALYNISGENSLSIQVVSDKQQIDVSSLARGTYILIIRKDNRTALEKLVIN
jgi:hypothetical protein